MGDIVSFKVIVELIRIRELMRNREFLEGKLAEDVDAFKSQNYDQIIEEIIVKHQLNEI